MKLLKGKRLKSVMPWEISRPLGGALSPRRVNISLVCCRKLAGRWLILRTECYSPLVMQWTGLRQAVHALVLATAICTKDVDEMILNDPS